MIRPVLRSGKVDWATVNESNKGEWMVFPNPVVDHFKINLPDPNEYFTLRIINSAGQEVKRINQYRGEQVQIDCAELPHGVYQLVAIGRESLITTTFVKN